MMCDNDVTMTAVSWQSDLTHVVTSGHCLIDVFLFFVKVFLIFTQNSINLGFSTFRSDMCTVTNLKMILYILLVKKYIKATYILLFGEIISILKVLITLLVEISWNFLLNQIVERLSRNWLNCYYNCWKKKKKKGRKE